MGAGFQCLYDNQHGLWDAMAGFWVTVAARFASAPNVLGYELINEVAVHTTYIHTYILSLHFPTTIYPASPGRVMSSASRRIWCRSSQSGPTCSRYTSTYTR